MASDDADEGQGDSGEDLGGKETEIRSERRLVLEHRKQDTQEFPRNDDGGGSVRVTILLHTVVVCAKPRIVPDCAPCGAEQALPQVTVAAFAELPAPLPSPALREGNVVADECNPLLGMGAARAQEL